VALGNSTQGLLTHWTERRRDIGFLLRCFLSGSTQQFPTLLLNLHLNITQVLSIGRNKGPHLIF